MKIKLSEEQGKPTCLTFVTPVTKQNKVLFSSFFPSTKKNKQKLSIFPGKSLITFNFVRLLRKKLWMC
jgi:hypothetical protein